MEESTFPAPSLDTWTTLFVLAAAQGLFLTITLVFSRKGHRPSNLILAGFIALFSLTLIEYVLHWTRYIYYLPQVNSFYLVFVFFFGPLLLLYFQSILSGRKMSLKSYLHLLQ